jgi:hypothetical protein
MYSSGVFQHLAFVTCILDYSTQKRDLLSYSTQKETSRVFQLVAFVARDLHLITNDRGARDRQLAVLDRRVRWAHGHAHGHGMVELAEILKSQCPRTKSIYEITRGSTFALLRICAV